MLTGKEARDLLVHELIEKEVSTRYKIIGDLFVFSILEKGEDFNDPYVISTVNWSVNKKTKECKKYSVKKGSKEFEDWLRASLHDVAENLERVS